MSKLEPHFQDALKQVGGDPFALIGTPEFQAKAVRDAKLRNMNSVERRAFLVDEHEAAVAAKSRAANKITSQADIKTRFQDLPAKTREAMAAALEDIAAENGEEAEPYSGYSYADTYGDDDFEYTPGEDAD